jgi:hypothetical protein
VLGSRTLKTVGRPRSGRQIPEKRSTNPHETTRKRFRVASCLFVDRPNSNPQSAIRTRQSPGAPAPVGTATTLWIAFVRVRVFSWFVLISIRNPQSEFCNPQGAPLLVGTATALWIAFVRIRVSSWLSCFQSSVTALWIVYRIAGVSPALSAQREQDRPRFTRDDADTITVRER